MLTKNKIREHLNSNSRNPDQDAIVNCYASLNAKYKNTFDFDKVWEVVEGNKNYLNATPDFDETQLKHYTTKFKEKFKDTVKVKDVDWEELVIDLLVIMLLRDNLPKPNRFNFNF